MNVKLNIHEDAELRAAVREMIKGHVKSITRAEILDSVRAEISGKIEKTGESRGEKIMVQEINKIVKGVLFPRFGPSFIKDEVRRQVNEALKGRINV